MTHCLRSFSILILSVTVLLIPGISNAQWQSEPSMTTPRAQFGVASQGNNIYVFGGYNPGELSSLEIFNTQTNTWTTGANMPGSTRGLTAASCNNGLIYALGGTGGVYASYDPGTDMWSNIPTPPNGSVWESAAGTGCNDMIHLLGGEFHYTEHFVYNTNTNMWSAAAQIPTGVMQHSAITVGDKIYVLGGTLSNQSTVTNLVQIYDVNTDTWSAGANMPDTRNQFGCYAVGTKIYMVGGKQAYGNFGTPIFSEVYIYDTVNDSWSAGPSLAQPTGELECIYQGGKLYAVGGYTTGSIVLNEVYSLELGKIAYLSSNDNPYPWGQQTYLTNQMNAVFGAGNWEDLRMENINPQEIFSSEYCFIYMEGSDDGTNGFNTFYQNNLAQIENFVDNGGRLLVNAAPNTGPSQINLGFGGFELNSFVYALDVVATDPAHPIWNGPFNPTSTSMSGGGYGHAILCPQGAGANSIIEAVTFFGPGTPGDDVLVELPYGDGLVLFGGMTTSNFHFPQPQAGNVRQNILVYAKEAASQGDPCDPDNTPPFFTTMPLPADVTVECDMVPEAAVLEADDACAVEPYAFVNELHYDNSGSDVNEGIEIAGVAGLNLDGWELVLYNGFNGTVYNTVALTGIIPDQQNGMGAINFAISGIQNGSPDGFALVDNGTVIQFLSYEGSFTANDGPAAGMMSTDIGIAESSGTPVGYSLQLSGSGNMYNDFNWSGPAPATPGNINTSVEQFFNSPGSTLTVTFNETRRDGSCPNEYTLFRTWTATDGAGNVTQHTQVITVLDNTPPTFCQPIPQGGNISCENWDPEVPEITANDNCNPNLVSMVDPWINEFHYDNSGTDVGEFIEIAGPGGLDLGNYFIYLYNGSGGSFYNVQQLSGSLPSNTCGYGFSVKDFPSNGIQNGSPDGIALVYDDGNTVQVIEFLSYEGSFTANNGPAAGISSTDVGVSESFSTPVGFSLQRSGLGMNGNDFMWIGPEPQTKGAVNINQQIEGSLTVDFNEVITEGNCQYNFTVVRTWTAEDLCGNVSIVSQTVNVFDNTPPTMVCQDVLVELDMDGLGSITPEDVDNGSFDNCSVSITLELIGRTEFNCTDIGESTVILQGTDECGNSARCTATVTVEDNLPPVFTSCPEDMTFSLDPGLCDIVFNYNVAAIDNCAEEAFQEDQTGGNEINLFNLTCGFAFTNVSYLREYPGRTGALVIDSVISGVSQATQTGNLTVNVYEYNGAGINFANFNQVGGASQLVPFGTATTLYNFPVGAIVPPGSDYVIETVAQSSVFGGIFVGLNSGGEISPTYVACGGVVLGDLDNLGFQQGVIQYVYGREVIAGGPVPVTPDPNNQYASGDALPIGGPYIFKYEACDNSGNCSTCEFEVYVEEFANPIRALKCNDDVQISLDENCEAEIGADQILEGGPYGCYDDYIVTIMGRGTNLLGKNDIGKTFNVVVTDPETGNSCMGRVTVEDKLPPQLLCIDTSILCDVDPSPFNTGFPVPPGADVINTGSDKCPVYVFTGFDNCSDVELRYKDWVTKGDCGSGFDQIITRTWTAEDEVGNEAQCVQTIVVELATLRDIGAPCNFDDIENPALTCDTRRDDSKDFSPHILRWFEGCVDDYLVDQEVLDTAGIRQPMDSIGWNYLETGPYAGHPSPYSIYWDAHPDFLATCRCWGPDEVVQWYGTGVPSGAECGNIQYTYKDSRFDIADMNCDAGEVGCYKLLREWTILDWCTGEIGGHIQIIKVTDDEGPEITYPEEVEVGMDVWSCEGTWDVPAPWITDNCSNDTRYEVEVITGTVFQKADGQWRVTNLEAGEHFAYITAFDCCGNATTDTVTLTVADDVPPVAVCESHTVVSIPGGQDPDNATAKIFAESFDDGSYDNCNPVWFKVIRMDNGRPCGASVTQLNDFVEFCCDDVGNTIMVRFLVFDIDPGPGPMNESNLRPGRPYFGHYTECMVEVEVQDKVQPTVVAPPTIVVSCDFWFDINALDDPEDPTFGRVVTNLADRGKVKTYDVVCPEWCEPNFKFNYFPPAGLEDKCALYDPVHPETEHELLWGFDGYALSSCGSSPTIIVNDQRECGQGRITRTISVPGGNGPVTATQTIYFVDCNPYFIEDENCFDFNQEDGVIWPCDYEELGCNLVSMDPDVFGRPTIVGDDNCSLVAVKYEDWVFDVVPNACFKILRKWTILDWCQYDPSINLTDGRWEYEQVILINDNTPPRFEGCEDVTFCDENAEFNATLGTCVGYAELLNPGEDACTPDSLIIVEYKIDAFNDGTFDFISSEYDQVVDNNPLADDESNARDASGHYPLGTHLIRWIVEDRCGNINNCDYLFTIEDCKKPTPYCRNGAITTVMDSTGCISIWASDFDIGSFDNCPGNLTFAFDTSGQILEREYCCDSLEASGGTSGIFELRVYVIDENGNYDYCTTYIRIDDTNDNCPNSSPIQINGEVAMMKNNSGINATDITLFDVSNQLISNQLTGSAGKYAFSNLLSGGEYEVIPAKNDDPLNGVTTQDLIAIQRHILGINEFNEAYEYIAADINRSNGISTKDIIALRKLILGSYDSFEEIHPDQRSWRFVEADHLFIDPSQPWNFNESTRFASLNKAEQANFKGVKIGDVNGSADPGINPETEVRNNENVSISAEDIVFSTGDQVSLKLNFADIAKTIGNQFTLEFDTDVLTFDGIDKLSTKINEANFGFTRINNGKITFSWNAFDNQAMGINEYATLIFKAKDSGKLSDFVKMNSSVTRAEAYFNIDDVSGLSLEFRTNGNVVDSYALFQNNPNPFRDETIIGFELPKAAKANVTIFDITGKTLRIIEVDGVKGYNEILIKNDEISANGILYYQLDTEGFTSTKKMVLVK